MYHAWKRDSNSLVGKHLKDVGISGRIALEETGRKAVNKISLCKN
jgi:hypothetical protein